MPTRVPTTDNPLSGLNLPPDYFDLTTEGMQLARLNGLKLQETPTDLVRAWSLFRTHFLKPEVAGWYKRWIPSPPAHYRIIRDIGHYPYNALGSPRSSAKSTIFLELTMLLFLTRRNFVILNVYPRDKMVTDRFSTRFQYQFEHNPLIIQDFGYVKPKVGDGIWNTSQLVNGKTRAVIKGMAVKGSLLGERPDLILCDDCENDPALQVAVTELILQFDRLIHNVILPMLDEGNTAIAVIGTLLSQRCWLSRWLHAEVEDDPRVARWNRHLYSAEDRNVDGSLFWEDKWDDEQLAADRELLGPTGYAAQRCNRPGEGRAAVLHIDPQLGQYTVEDPDDRYESPNICALDSQSVLVSHKKYDENIVEVRRPLGKAVSGMFRIVTMDYARCESPQSDMVCFVVTGIENSKEYKDTWWLLDLFLGRVRGESLYRTLLTMGLKWRTQYIGIESIAAQIECVERAEAYLPAMADRYAWHPRVFPIKYPHNLGKDERINALEWRYGQNRVKYPRHRRHKAMWSLAYQQTMDWTGEEGCLRFDDFIDTVAMIPFMVKSRRLPQEDNLPDESRVDLGQAIMAGESHLPGGLPIAHALLPGEMNVDVLKKIGTRHPDEVRASPRRNKRWMKVGIRK
jgi:hypothetical protein